MKRNLDNLFDQIKKEPTPIAQDELLEKAFSQWNAKQLKWTNFKKWTIMSTLSIIAVFTYFIVGNYADEKALYLPTMTLNTIPQNEQKTQLETYSTPPIKQSLPLDFDTPIEKDLKHIVEKLKVSNLPNDTPHKEVKISTPLHSQQYIAPMEEIIPEYETQIPVLEHSYKVRFQLSQKADMDALTQLMAEAKVYGLELSVVDFEIEKGNWKHLSLNVKYKYLTTNSRSRLSFITKFKKLKSNEYYDFSWNVTPSRNVDHFFKYKLKNPNQKIPDYQLVKEKVSPILGDTIRLYFTRDEGKKGLETYIENLEKMGQSVKLKKVTYDEKGAIVKLKLSYKKGGSTFSLNTHKFTSLESYWIKDKDGNYHKLRNNTNHCCCGTSIAPVAPTSD